MNKLLSYEHNIKHFFLILFSCLIYNLGYSESVNLDYDKGAVIIKSCRQDCAYYIYLDKVVLQSSIPYDWPETTLDKITQFENDTSFENGNLVTKKIPNDLSKAILENTGMIDMNKLHILTFGTNNQHYSYSLSEILKIGLEANIEFIPEGVYGEDINIVSPSTKTINEVIFKMPSTKTQVVDKNVVIGIAFIADKVVKQNYFQKITFKKIEEWPFKLIPNSDKGERYLNTLGYTFDDVTIFRSIFGFYGYPEGINKNLKGSEKFRLGYGLKSGSYIKTKKGLFKFDSYDEDILVNNDEAKTSFYFGSINNNKIFIKIEGSSYDTATIIIIDDAGNVKKIQMEPPQRC